MSGSLDGVKDINLILKDLQWMLKSQGWSLSVVHWQNVYDLIYHQQVRKQLPANVDELNQLLSPLLCTNPSQQEELKGFIKRSSVNIQKNNRAVAVHEVNSPDIKRGPVVEYTLDDWNDRQEITHNKRPIKKFSWFRRIKYAVFWVFILLFFFTLKVDTFDKGNITPTPTPTFLTPSPTPQSVQPVEGNLVDDEKILYEFVNIRSDKPSSALPFLIGLCIFLSLLLFVIIFFLVFIGFLQRSQFESDHKASKIPYKKHVFAMNHGKVQSSLIIPKLTVKNKKKNNIVYSQKINWDDTLRHSINNPGIFKLHYREKNRTLSYLILIDRVSANDQITTYSRMLFNKLKSIGLIVHSFSFVGDLRYCYNEAHTQLFHIKKLRHHYRHSSLIIFSDAQGAVNAFSGELHPWLDILCDWQQRCWLTPDAMLCNHKQHDLAEKGFAVAPLSIKGVNAIFRWLSENPNISIRHQKNGKLLEVVQHECFPETFKNDDYWLNEFPDNKKLKKLNCEKVLKLLTDYLGDDGLRLLCACAVYPKIHVYITLTLEMHLFHDLHGKIRPDDREERLLKLSRLPWFRHGKMPFYLRQYLSQRLSTSDYLLIKKIIYENDSIHTPSFDSFESRVYDQNSESKTTTNTELPVVDPLLINMFGGWYSKRSKFLPKNAFVHSFLLKPVVKKILLLLSSVTALLFTFTALWIGSVVFSSHSNSISGETLQIPIPKMVEIPAGTFTMGCLSADMDCFDNEKPAHEVSISAFQMSATEVTFNQYDAYCDQVESCERPNDEGWGRGSRPVINVSWDDAQKYIQWLNEKTGKTYRLPTEAEWEYAARAGSQTKYCWGNESSGEHANGYDRYGLGNWPKDGFKNTAPVGNYLPNAFGLYDIHGNVLEWVQDRYDENYYIGSPTQDPRGPSDPSFSDRVLRGGSWFGYARLLRSATRGRNTPGSRNDDVGFRLSLGPSSSDAAKPPVLQVQINGIPVSKMVKVPSGTFRMGCLSNDSDCQANEKPVHEVSISEFEMAATEVTFEQYDAYCDQVESCERPEDEGWGRGSRPVINVSWNDAQKYIQWLNEKTGKTYRLPTEAEWEYAARSGSQTKMVKVPSGTFRMGCLSNDSDCQDNGKPVHEVSISEFKMAAMEVIFEQYDAYCDQVESCERPEYEGWGRGSRPVINVSWNDAQKYIQWLNEKAGKTYRLPTEAVWEYAVRAGSQTKYSWGNESSGEHANGDDRDGLGNWPKDGFENTAPVGNYLPNAFGLYDMHGNVWEWVQDRHDENYYENSSTQDPSGPSDPSIIARVIRGGSWLDSALILRSAIRSGNIPDYWKFDLGFRLSLGKPPVVLSSPSPQPTAQPSVLPPEATPTPTLTPTAELTIPLPEMVSIPAGRFQMGCLSNASDCIDDEKPVHEVNISAFKMSATEVTFEQYDFYCDQVESCDRPGDQGWGRGTRPVINVSWNDAQAFIQWLNEQTGKRYRLPTEAEWEYAAKASTQTKYFWGDNASSDRANYKGNIRRTQEVGQYAANAWGLFDMHGNVWEWVQDRYDENYYANSPNQDPSGPSDQTLPYRVLRGGGWFDIAQGLRSADRGRNQSAYRGNDSGFRLSLDE